MKSGIGVSFPTKRLKHVVVLRRIAHVSAGNSARPYVGLEHIQSDTGRLVGDATQGGSTDGDTVSGTGSQSIEFEHGDLLFGKLRPYLAKAWLAEFPGRCTTEALVIRPTSIDPGFLRNVCLSPWFVGTVDASTFGSKMPRAEWDFIGNIPVPVPSVIVQKAVADYLDHETEQLDGLVAAHGELLGLLTEKHRAMIACAVTRGLDPHAPMRDSGVPWLGEVPAHWSVERARWLFRERDQRSDDGAEELLTVSHLTGVTPRSEKDVNMFEADTLAGYKRCQPGDLVINTLWAWMGAMGVSFGEGVVSPAYNVYEPTDELDPAYVDALSRLPVFAQEAIRHSKGVWSSRLRLYPEGFFRMSLPLPPLSEQRQIVAALQSKREQLSRLETAATKAIGLLKERRAALIAAAVTGSIEVPTTARDAERIDDHEDEGRDPPQRGTLSQDFWASPALDELAAAQGVGPLDTEALLGTWPGEDDDGFEDAIDELRHAGMRQDVE